MARRQQDTQAEQAIQKALEEVNDKIVRGEQGDEDKDEDETGENRNFLHEFGVKIETSNMSFG